MEGGWAYLDVEYIKKGDESESAAAPEAIRPVIIEERIFKCHRCVARCSHGCGTNAAVWRLNAGPKVDVAGCCCC